MTRRSSRSASNNREGQPAPLRPENSSRATLPRKTATTQPKTTRRRAGHAKPLEPCGARKRTAATHQKALAHWNRCCPCIGTRSPVLGWGVAGWPRSDPPLCPFSPLSSHLILSYTYLEYQYEYDERAIKEGRKELRDLRHHEQSLRGRFESQLQRSRLDEDMADVGLTAPSAPPTALPANITAP